ncbi:hypothetical protein CLORY_18510 [Clostridium oryzae]|uniref:Uncharacterized protein n=1 Tax=Clostridium oryzae TaxID=1450648 RepID=A0A1V4IQR8_9CLOT|nr:hypothetical protein CLORY_18510 [Clostridium oryzae]
MKWQIRLLLVKTVEKSSSSQKENRLSTKKKDLKMNLRDVLSAEKLENRTTEVSEDNILWKNHPIRLVL